MKKKQIRSALKMDKHKLLTCSTNSAGIRREIKAGKTYIRLHFHPELTRRTLPGQCSRGSDEVLEASVRPAHDVTALVLADLDVPLAGGTGTTRQLEGSYVAGVAGVHDHCGKESSSDLQTISSFQVFHFQPAGWIFE